MNKYNKGNITQYETIDQLGEEGDVDYENYDNNIHIQSTAAEDIKAKASECPFNPSMPVIDQILEDRGYRIDTFKNIFLCFCVLCIEGLEMTQFSLMIIPLKGFYLVSDKVMGMISSTIFVGVGVGAILSGYLSSKWGRTHLINFFLFVIFASNALTALTASYVLFGILRLFIGFGLGLIVPISINLLAEYLPIRNRALVLTSVWIGYGVGCLYLLLAIFFIMPNYEVDKVKFTLFISSLFPFLTFLFNCTNLRDSPRNLILRGETEEAFEILEKIQKAELSDASKARILREVKQGNVHIGTRSQSHFFEIFRGKFTKLTILLASVWFIDSFVTYGTGIIQSFTLKSLGAMEKYENKEIIIKQIIITMISSTGTIFGGSLSEVSFLGRNKTTVLTFILSASFLLLLTFFSNLFTWFLSFAQFFWSIALNVNTTYSCEVYPTHIRDHALGFLFFSTRLGGFVSQLIFIYLNDLGMWIPYYFAASLFFLNTILVFNFPYETYGKPLDSNQKSDMDNTIKTV